MVERVKYKDPVYLWMSRLDEGAFLPESKEISLNLGSAGEEDGSSVKQWTLQGCVSRQRLTGERAARQQEQCWKSLVVGVWTEQP